MKKWQIHAIFNCTDCRWNSENYLNAASAARKHASQHGHFVSGEIGYHVEFGTETRKQPKKASVAGEVTKGKR